MRPPSDTSLCLLHDGSGAAEKLCDEPEEEDDACGEGGALPETDEGGNERVNAVPGKECKVRAQYSRYCAGCSEHGDIAPKEHGKLCECCDDASEEIEDEKLRVTEVSLDIIAEDPQVPHVEEDVGEASVEEL